MRPVPLWASLSNEGSMHCSQELYYGVDFTPSSSETSRAFLWFIQSEKGLSLSFKPLPSFSAQFSPQVCAKSSYKSSCGVGESGAFKRIY